MLNDQDFESDFKQKLEGAVLFVKNEVSSIRSGKASPSLIENLIVDTYGGESKLKLMELSTIGTDGSSGLVISPFDPATIKDIERAIMSSPLNLTPRTDGHKIHIKLPLLSEEQRLKFIKLVHSKVEEGRVRMRGTRDEFRKKLKLSLESKEISEDSKFRLEKLLDTVTKEYTEIFDEIKSKKEKELMEV